MDGLINGCVSVGWMLRVNGWWTRTWTVEVCMGDTWMDARSADGCADKFITG